MNLYGYVLNDPINRRDPRGLDSQWPCSLAVTAHAGIVCWAACLPATGPAALGCGLVCAGAYWGADQLLGGICSPSPSPPPPGPTFPPPPGPICQQPPLPPPCDPETTSCP
jgi:hypothetical protein